MRAPEFGSVRVGLIGNRGRTSVERSQKCSVQIMQVVSPRAKGGVGRPPALFRQPVHSLRVDVEFY